MQRRVPSGKKQMTIRNPLELVLIVGHSVDCRQEAAIVWRGRSMSSREDVKEGSTALTAIRAAAQERDENAGLSQRVRERVSERAGFLCDTRAATTDSASPGRARPRCPQHLN